MDLSTKRSKKEMNKRHTPKTKLLLTSSLAFIFGGIISAVGEFLRFCFEDFPSPVPCSARKHSAGTKEKPPR